jgi:hypothetical protein
LLGWLARWFGWLFLTAVVTLGGAAVLMLFKDWTVKSLFTSMMAWPALGAAMLAGMLIALLPLGRLYFLTAIGGGMLYNLILLVA